MTVSTADELYELAKSLPARERLRLVEIIAHDLTHTTPLAAGPPPTKALTVAELLSLLSSAPLPDDDYALNVDAIVESQPEVQPVALTPRPPRATPAQA